MKAQFSDWPLDATDTVIAKLLFGACTEIGYCLSQDDNDRICAMSFDAIGEFASEVMMAEGLSPEMHRDLFRGLCAWVCENRSKFS
ncbi:hypothetical protein [uncultured Tateyamaria sp.]|uniref:hypothetical protein n=1 Tax=uncultured Tateyamaria sp. TaxID=455651 RepID=UPI002630649B|nr:hypothetical protein [uncultured Tateyamaria sp.]